MCYKTCCCWRLLCFVFAAFFTKYWLLLAQRPPLLALPFPRKPGRKKEGHACGNDGDKKESHKVAREGVSCGRYDRAAVRGLRGGRRSWSRRRPVRINANLRIWSKDRRNRDLCASLGLCPPTVLGISCALRSWGATEGISFVSVEAYRRAGRLSCVKRSSVCIEGIGAVCYVEGLHCCSVRQACKIVVPLIVSVFHARRLVRNPEVACSRSCKRKVGGILKDEVLGKGD